VTPVVLDWAIMSEGNRGLDQDVKMEGEKTIGEKKKRARRGTAERSWRGGKGRERKNLWEINTTASKGGGDLDEKKGERQTAYVLGRNKVKNESGVPPPGGINWTVRVHNKKLHQEELCWRKPSLRGLSYRMERLQDPKRFGGRVITKNR